MTERLVIVSRYDRTFSSPFTVTFLIFKVAQRNLRKETNIIVNFKMLLWKTSSTGSSNQAKQELQTKPNQGENGLG